MAIFALFAWIVASIEILDQETANVIVSMADRVGVFLSVHAGHLIFALLTLGVAVFAVASAKLCWMNSRAAMREIYLTDATSEQVVEVKLLLAVTLFALMAFVPRFMGLRH
jgi:hypothetical protein